MFRSHLLLYFMSLHHSLPFGSRNTRSRSQSADLLPRGSSCHGWGLTCLCVFYLKWAVESNAFHYSLFTTILMLCRFFPPFFVWNAGDSPTGWKEQAGTSTNGQLIGFMVHLAVQNIACLLLVFNTQFDVNLKTFYIILLHTCTQEACQTKCGVMNVIIFLRAAGMQNSWEGIYLCQHGRCADYCRRWGKKVRVWIYQKGRRRANILSLLEHMTVGYSSTFEQAQTLTGLMLSLLWWPLGYSLMVR